MEKKVVENPVWLKAILYIAIGIFPILSGYLFYFTFSTFSKDDIWGTLSVLFFAMGSAYISYIGFTLAKFVSARVEYDENQFEVRIKGALTEYKWADIASIKNYHGSQILKLYDQTGKTIYVVDHMTPGYDAFFEKVSQIIET